MADPASQVLSPVCAVSGAVEREDSWRSVIFSSRSSQAALYSLRACVEEPAFHVYSQLSTHTTHTTLHCLCLSNGTVVEVEADVYRVALPSWSANMRTYMACFRLISEEEDEGKWAVVQTLVRRAQHMLWARDLDPSAASLPCTRQDT